MNTLWLFLQNHSVELLQETKQQLYLVGMSVGIAILLGVAIGIVIAIFRRYKTVVLSSASVLWTIPSLALLSMMIPFLGIGSTPAIVVLTLYALLPIIRNTYTGLVGVSPIYIEAAQVIGFTRWQRLWIVELPLALPVIMAGIRTATAMSVGVATLAAFIGAGGLGDFINRGLATNNTALILLGAIPSALMALVLDSLLAIISSRLQTRRRHVHKKWMPYFIIFILIVAGGSSFLFLSHKIFSTKKQENVIRIATKNFTEQFILGEMMSQLIEAKTNLKVVRKFNLGTIAIVHQALLNDEVDLYPEYTGTAYMTILKKNYHKNTSAEEIYKIVKIYYKDNFQLSWLKPFGFENTQALTVRNQFAKRHHIKTISELVPIANRLTIGASAEFQVRQDALPGLVKTYGIKFKSIKILEPNLSYQAIAAKEVDVIMAFSTDGRIDAYDLTSLIDDKHSFPPYYAAPVIREGFLKKHPKVAKILNQLSGKISAREMMQLNYKVDHDKLSPKKVAHEFLRKRFNLLFL